VESPFDSQTWNLKLQSGMATGTPGRFPIKISIRIIPLWSGNLLFMATEMD
jgi:hypothetical protein